MKIFLSFISIILFNVGYSQEDFSKNVRVCPIAKKNIEEYDVGMYNLFSPAYLERAYLIFKDLTKKEPKSCDAHYYTAYCLTLLKKHIEANKYYYIADSLSEGRSYKMKSNLAKNSFIVGRNELSRKKYIELKEIYPNDAIGYYGIALTSTKKGDFENGLNNINIVYTKDMEEQGKGFDIETHFLKAVLLSATKKYEESIEYFDKSYSVYKNHSLFNTYYALSLLKLSETNGNTDLLKKAKKVYKKIKGQEFVTPELKKEFTPLQ